MVIEEISLQNTSTFYLIIIQLRLKQWTKNFLLYAALLFSFEFTEVDKILLATYGFMMFSLTASSIYILNDFNDIEADRHHPTKQFRPMASGKLNPKLALFVGVFLLTLSLVSSFLMNKLFFLILLIYFVSNVLYSIVLKHIVIIDIMIIAFGFVLRAFGGAIVIQVIFIPCVLFFTLLLFFLIFLIYFVSNVLYSIVLKHIVIIDIMIIAFGFVLRAIGGAIVIQVHFTPWFLLCAMLLSLFLAIGKRRHELTLALKHDSSHRKVLDDYSLPFLDQLTSIVSSATIVSYAVFTFTSGHSIHLMWTIPFVVYGIFRYLYLIHVKDEGGAPEKILLEDKHILFTVVLYVVSVVVILTFFH